MNQYSVAYNSGKYFVRVHAHNQEDAKRLGFSKLYDLYLERNSRFNNMDFEYSSSSFDGIVWKVKYRINDVEEMNIEIISNSENEARIETISGILHDDSIDYSALNNIQIISVHTESEENRETTMTYNEPQTFEVELMYNDSALKKTEVTLSPEVINSDTEIVDRYLKSLSREQTINDADIQPIRGIEFISSNVKSIAWDVTYLIGDVEKTVTNVIAAEEKLAQAKAIKQLAEQYYNQMDYNSMKLVSITRLTPKATT
ncbi:hypothetical protein IC620_15385 [Hazenella sp. IB182357]|uniref:Uncharacterized protein n=1 Tax=Polycladospora coralii TaxID=2771432 RepID=A0A926NI65_9BACL|nr:hypothetical protein [Polycladospora coralii]MBD1373728.1 hypothetical protein [Polycladospora coralii]